MTHVLTSGADQTTNSISGRGWGSNQAEPFGATTTHHPMPPNTLPAKWLIVNDKQELWYALRKYQGSKMLGVHPISMYLRVYLTGVHLIYESSLRAGHGWRESLYRHQGCLEASDCGRLGRQAAGHPWSALRVVKSCRKDCPTAEVLLEAKAAALHPERYQSLLSKLSTKREGEAGKRSAGNRIG